MGEKKLILTLVVEILVQEELNPLGQCSVKDNPNYIS